MLEIESLPKLVEEEVYVEDFLLSSVTLLKECFDVDLVRALNFEVISNQLYHVSLLPGLSGFCIRKSILQSESELDSADLSFLL